MEQSGKRRDNLKRLYQKIVKERLSYDDSERVVSRYELREREKSELAFSTQPSTVHTALYSQSQTIEPVRTQMPALQEVRKLSHSTQRLAQPAPMKRQGSRLRSRSNTRQSSRPASNNTRPGSSLQASSSTMLKQHAYGRTQALG